MKRTKLGGEKKKQLLIHFLLLSFISRRIRLPTLLRSHRSTAEPPRATPSCRTRPIRCGRPQRRPRNRHRTISGRPHITRWILRHPQFRAAFLPLLPPTEGSRLTTATPSARRIPPPTGHETRWGRPRARQESPPNPRRPLTATPRILVQISWTATSKPNRRIRRRHQVF